MQEAQKLMIEFPDYMNVLVKMLNSCIKSPHRHVPHEQHTARPTQHGDGCASVNACVVRTDVVSFLAVLLLKRDGKAQLDIIQVRDDRQK